MSIGEIILIALAVAILASVVVLIVLVIRSKPNSGGGVDDKLMQGILSNVLLQVKAIVDEDSRIAASNMANMLQLNHSSIGDSVSRYQGAMQERLDSLKASNDEAYKSINNSLLSHIREFQKETSTMLTQMKDNEEMRGKNMRDLLDRKISELQGEVKDNLTHLRTENEKKLNEMREVVDEKLQTTLNSRISESFKVINAQLESVNKGLGEMQSLSGSVDNLNRVLSGVKHRGVWGEVQLENLLSQILTPKQYDSQVQISGDNKVDFAVIMPGKDGDKLILPIDAKFPLADYEKFVDACEGGIKENVLAAKKALVAAIKIQAKSISSKYISVPKTTNFAVMYLPIEGLYAELVREPQLMDELHNDKNILLCGPTTLTALLTSLQMGFKTLAIQERSSEVWKTLSKFRKDFNIFVGLLDKSRKKAGEIVSTIDDGLDRSRIINKRLDKLVSDEDIEMLIEDKEVDND